MKRLTCALLFLFVFANHCLAEEEFPQMEQCLNDAITHPDMVECLSDEYSRQDRRLNAAYKKAALDLSPERKKLLLDAQRAWVSYKEKYASFLYDPDGGQIAQLDSISWLVQATAARAKELEESIE